MAGTFYSVPACSRLSLWFSCMKRFHCCSLILCSAHQSSLCLPLRPNIENQNVGAKKKCFFLRSCPNFEQNPTVIFFLFCNLFGTWTLKEAGGCTVSSDVFFSSDRYRVSCLSWMIKRLLAAKLNSNISSSEHSLLCRNERRQRTRAAWEAIKATVRASWRTELPGPRVTKWQRLLPPHSVSSVGGWRGCKAWFVIV